VGREVEGVQDDDGVEDVDAEGVVEAGVDDVEGVDEGVEEEDDDGVEDEVEGVDVEGVEEGGLRQPAGDVRWSLKTVYRSPAMPKSCSLNETSWSVNSAIFDKMSFVDVEFSMFFLFSELMFSHRARRRRLHSRVISRFAMNILYGAGFFSLRLPELLFCAACAAACAACACAWACARALVLLPPLGFVGVVGFAGLGWMGCVAGIGTVIGVATALGVVGAGVAVMGSLLGVIAEEAGVGAMGKRVGWVLAAVNGLAGTMVLAGVATVTGRCTMPGASGFVTTLDVGF
jgi:hypothetical protein